MPHSTEKNNPQIPSDYRRLEGSEHVPHPKTTRLEPAPADETATIQLIVRRRPDGPPLKGLDYFQKVPVRARRLPTRQEFEENHGATQADLDLVAEFCRSHRLEVLESNRSQRRVVVRGAVANLNAAFAIQLHHYQSPVGKYRGFEGAAHLPAALAGIVEHVNGLDNRPIPVHHLGVDPAPIGPLTPPTVAQLYSFPPGTGSGQTIGIMAYPTWGFIPADVTATLGNWSVASTAPLSAFPSAANPPNTGAFETTMDITIARAIAPKASIVVYFVPNSGSASNPNWTATGIINTLTSMINPAGADPAAPNIINICYAFSPDDETSFVTASEYKQMSTLFQEAANQAITVLSGCNDQGPYVTFVNQTAITDSPTQARAVYPGTDPFVLCCGGTSVGNITSTGGINGPQFDEYVWNDTWVSVPPSSSAGTKYAGATGGGISALFPIPPYQTAVTMPTRLNTGFAGRGIPDVAGNASPNSGYVVTVEGNAYSQIGGSSAVAPLYAGLIAIVNQTLGESVGFLNPTIYALANSICRDVTGAAGPANNNFPVLSSSGAVTSTITGYNAGVGWDACTGWGSINGSALLAALEGILTPSMTFIMDRSTFSQDEVTANNVFKQAIFVVVDGLKPGDFPNGGITATSDSPTPPGPPSPLLVQQWAPVIPPAGPNGAANITFTATAVSSEGPTLSAEVQRFTFTYEVTFPDQTPFTTPNAANFPLTVNLTASLAAAGSNATAQIELIRAADPFFSSESNGGLSWLSDDIRVFNAIEGSKLFGAPQLGNTPAAARSFIQWIVSNLSGPLGTGPSGETFENTLASGETASALSLNATTPPDASGQTQNIYNFAIARVRLNGTAAANQANMVRVFFRLFQGQSTAIGYQAPPPGSGISSATGPYRQYSDGGTDGIKIPLLGISPDGSEYVTVPCFASERATSLGLSMTTQTDAPWNAKPIVPVPGNTVYTYFGCWLDTNQSEKLFPYGPVGQVNGPDGPFSPPTYTLSQVLVRGGHQCLIAEIVDDEAPILDNATPATSDKIAQRNLAFSVVANPGIVGSRLATHTFEIKPSLTTLNADELPDELMIDWGNVPIGTVASIYLPAVPAADILALAARMYATHALTASDPHTLECPAGGIAYIPIPKGSGANYAGLFSVQLPAGIKKGQEFKIVVRQVTSAIKRKGNFARRVSGAFQISIPVSIKDQMLVPEERFLSVMRWIQETIPPDSRWYPIFLRYLDQIAERVSGLGGDPASVPPTQSGLWPGLYAPSHGDRGIFERTGKIAGLIFDSFGDFEGFLLETQGAEHKYFSREKAIRELVEWALRERLRVTVWAKRDEPHRALSIVVR